MSHGHEIVKCSRCSAIVMQCRGLAKDKAVRYVDGCSACKGK